MKNSVKLGGFETMAENIFLLPTNEAFILVIVSYTATFIILML